MEAGIQMIPEQFSDTLALEIVWVSLLLVGSLTLLVILFIIISRIWSSYRQRRKKEIEKIYEDQINRYLSTGDKSAESVIKELKSYSESFHIEIFTQICLSLKESLEGEYEQLLHKLMRSSYILNYYKEALKQFSEKDNLRALRYFAAVATVPDQDRNQLLGWVKDRKHVIAHASAKVLLSTAEDEDQSEVLKFLTARTENRADTLLSLLWIYWNNDAVSKRTKVHTMISLLKKEDVSLSVKTRIMQLISESHECGDDMALFLHELLKELIEKEKLNTSADFSVALISTIGSCKVKEAVSTIEKCIGRYSLKISNACIDALFKIGDSQATKILRSLLSDEHKQFFKEISYQAFLLPEKAEDIGELKLFKSEVPEYMSLHESSRN